MPWGKYRGKSVKEVPMSYLAFVVEECTGANPFLVCECKREIALRIGVDFELSHSRPVIESSIKNKLIEWHRRASVKFHPDVGGNVELMKTLNEAREIANSIK